MHRRPFLLAAGTALAAPAFVRAQSRPVLKVGLGPQQPTQADTKRVWEPVFRRACDQIGADLDLTVANDWAGISVALATRQIDVAQMGPWGYVLAKQKGDAQAIVNNEQVRRVYLGNSFGDGISDEEERGLDLG